MTTTQRIDPFKMRPTQIAAILLNRHGRNATKVIRQRVESAGMANYAKVYQAAAVIITEALTQNQTLA